jgi:outer membrane lipoprotein SlyB
MKWTAKSLTLGLALAASITAVPQSAMAHDRDRDRDYNRDRDYQYNDRSYDYRRSSRSHNIDYGRVENVRRISLRGGHNSGAGTVAGAVIGGAIGSEIGEGDAAHAVGILGGAIIGGLIGTAIEEDVSDNRRRNGYEYTIRRDDGYVFRVVQRDNRRPMNRGMRVRIIDGPQLRIEPEHGYRNSRYNDRYDDRYRDRHRRR